ncbi:unnamed protein product [Sphenostylis stenocarpa]|uniref:Uncharacterized protein n=1 Tax=Sphenostylis stenocarpa TaxID=92480 RepID=A0AA86W1H7_9FABA|nr:unnamed protein product [Sphenostylis stenocarpa]
MGIFVCLIAKKLLSIVSKLIYKNFLGSVTKPVSADAAAVYGEARYIWPSMCPIRPGKFRFVVDTHTCIE